jgi:hypothetical protein
MLPQVLDQQIVHSFKYWNDGVRLGMRHGQKLYARVRSYAARDRLQAYALGCELAEQGHDICITRSEWRYTIWISLQADLHLAGLPVESSSASEVNASISPDLAPESEPRGYSSAVHLSAMPI